jgi:hypothetical protein
MRSSASRTSGANRARSRISSGVVGTRLASVSARKSCDSTKRRPALCNRKRRRASATISAVRWAGTTRVCTP